jgi:hypothetical protein
MTTGDDAVLPAWARDRGFAQGRDPATLDTAGKALMLRHGHDKGRLRLDPIQVEATDAVIDAFDNMLTRGGGLEVERFHVRRVDDTHFALVAALTGFGGRFCFPSRLRSISDYDTADAYHKAEAMLNDKLGGALSLDHAEFQLVERVAQSRPSPSTVNNGGLSEADVSKVEALWQAHYVFDGEG